MVDGIMIAKIVGGGIIGTAFAVYVDYILRNRNRSENPPRGLIKIPGREKTYYCEWLVCWGWGVMTQWGTYKSRSRTKLAYTKPPHSYTQIPMGRNGYYELIVPVKKEHLDLSDKELEKIYGSEPHAI